ncbi:LytR/AlgR family response regulator transcription factor [Enterococcus hirae]
MTLPIFICDDDKVVNYYYKRNIENTIMINGYEMEVVLSTTDPYKIIDYLTTEKITNGIFFLDIDLGISENGIDVAKKIRKLTFFAKIVFITSHKEFAFESLKKRIAPLDYLIKDGSEKKQIKNILQEIHNDYSIDTHKESKYFIFNIGSRQIKISVDTIYFIETSVSPHKVCLYGENIMYEFYGKLHLLEKEYPEFVRVHKSVIINPSKIISVDYKKREILFPEEYSCFFSYVNTQLLKKIIKQNLN